MRLYTVEVKTPVGGVQRLMAEADGMLVDLNAAGGVYYQAQGDTNPQQLADANLPNDMVTFFWNGARSLEAGKAVMQFMQTNAPAQGLAGQQLVYRMCDVTVLAPVTKPNIIFDGMVYEGHVKHHYGEIPAGYYKRPVWNTQSGSTVVGTGAPLFKPKYTEQFDFEFELGFHDIVMADTFEEAFEKCVEYAQPGDAVLLSPACASWGMFKNYEERGDKFKELVNRL